MPLPMLSKTWQFDVNRVIPAQGSAIATHRLILRTIKDRLKAFTMSPWVVRYSCDSVAAGAAGDGVDRWDSDTDLVWAVPGVAHSWIVLRQAGFGHNVELLISCEQTSAFGSILTLYVSPNNNFTGGSTVLRPTATDEIDVVSNNHWIGNSGSALQFVIHMMMSVDGQCTRVFIYQNNIVVAFWLIDKPQNPVTGWNNSVVGHGRGSSSITEWPTYANLSKIAAASAPTSGRGVSTMRLNLTSEGYGSAYDVVGIKQTVVNDLSAEAPMMPIGLASDTASNRGRHGSLFDLWWGLQGFASGDTYPNDATRQFAQHGDLISPWNGSAIVTA